MAAPLLGSLIFGAASTAGLLAGAASTKLGEKADDARQKARGIGAAAKSPSTYGGAVMKMSKVALKSQIAFAQAANPMRLAKAAVDGPTKLVGGLKKMGGKAMGIMGISMSVSSLLRQSQLFTGLLGALFQVIGGFIDVILAPFMPYLFKVVGMLAQQIPKVRELAQKVHDWLAQNIFPIIGEWVGKLIDPLVGLWNWIKETLWPPVQEGLGLIWETIKDIWGLINDIIWPPIQKFIDDTKEKIGNLIPDFGALLAPIDINLTSILDTVKEKAEAIMLWVAKNIMPVIEKVRDILFENLAKILDFIWVLVDETIWPGLQRVFKSFNENIVPVLAEVRDKALELVNAILDVVTPLLDVILALLKPLYKLVWWALENILKILFSLIKILWQYVIKHIVNLVIWALKLLPNLLSSLANFIEGFFKFDWLKKFLAGMLDGVLWMVTAIGKIPMISTDNAQEQLNAVISKLRTVSPMGGETKIELHQNVNGVPQPTEQMKFDSVSGTTSKMLKGADVMAGAGSLEPNLAFAGI